MHYLIRTESKIGGLSKKNNFHIIQINHRKGKDRIERK